LEALEWAENKLRVLDQTKLPHDVIYLELDNYQDVAWAIKEMRIRGAPAIGVAAAYGIALGAQGIKTEAKGEFLAELHHIFEIFSSTRPTAVNLFKAIARMKRRAQGDDIPQIKAALAAEASKIHAEEEEATRGISKFGAELIKDDFTILTHCNTGALATAGYGTALGIIKAANEQEKRVHVFVTETRPLLQGARLTAWELMEEKIPLTLIVDTMAGFFLHEGEIDCVIVGADRITANGDVANKIGTYTIAVLAMENAVPFYVAAPTSTIDLELLSGNEIPIEGRSPEEVTHVQGVRIAPEGIEVANPAFDITPHRYVTAIITEKGIIKEPYEKRLGKITKTTSGKYSLL
jgi:methylthioribose-1-phosphate isomerase